MQPTATGLPHPRRVFISYAHEDATTARSVARALGDEGFNVWLGEWHLEPGSDLQEGIRRAIQSSDAAVVLLSPAAVDSRWLQEEVELLLARELDRRGIDLVPVLIADCPVPRDLRDRGTVDLRDNPIETLAERLRRGSAVDLSTLDPSEFEALVADILRADGYTVDRPSRTSQDAGFDFLIRAEGSDTTFEGEWMVEAKHYSSGRISPSVIRQLSSFIERAPGRRGILVTSGHLTSVALNELVETEHAREVDIRVIDGTELRHRILAHPEVFDRHFRSVRET
jgi:hypothetical protein